MSTVDAVQLEIIRNALVAAAEEMSVTIWRTARSTVVRETLDYSTAIFDGEGRAVAQAARIPVHLNSMSVCLEEIVRRFIPLDDWHDGDVILTNDPYCGGQHLPDFVAFRPVFVDGRRVGISGTVVHHIDVSGGAAGSYYAQAREVYHEGLRIPPCKIVEAGRPNRALMAVIRQNSREPEKIAGDLQAQLAALEVGAAALRRMVARYGADALGTAMGMILDQSDAAMRAVIGRIPDGTYAFEDFVDDDGITDAHLRIRARVTVAGERCTVDLSGSSPQATGPVNCTLNMAKSGVYCALVMLGDGRVMANSGAYRPIEIVAEPGTVVHCSHPAPVANRMATGHRIVTTVLGALAEALPDRVPAAYYGVSYVYALSTSDAGGNPRVYFEIEVGGWGAHPEQDGADGFSAGFHNLANSPVEMIEALHPIAFTHYRFIPDSGGAGRRRGGLGLSRELRLDADHGAISGNFERFRVAPYGLAGGAPGSKGRFLLLRADGETVELPSKCSGVQLRRGDRVRLETSGGGGHGPAAERDPAAVAHDLADGYVTPDGAARDYEAR